MSAESRSATAEDEPIRLRHDSDAENAEAARVEAAKARLELARREEEEIARDKEARLARRREAAMLQREKEARIDKARMSRRDSTHKSKVRRVPHALRKAPYPAATAVGVVLVLVALVMVCLRRRRRTSRRHSGRAKRDEFNRWDPRAGAAPSWTKTALPPTVKRNCQRGDRDAVLQWLRSSAGNPDARDANARTACHHAAVSGHAELTRALLENGASPDAVDLAKQTPLHAAAHAGSASAVRVLLDAGADVTLEDADNRTPLAVAQAAGNHGCARLIQRRERAIAKASTSNQGDSLHLRHATSQLDAAL